MNPSEIRSDLRRFCLENHIELIEADVGVNKEPFLSMNIEAISLALNTLIKISNEHQHAINYQEKKVDIRNSNSSSNHVTVTSNVPSGTASASNLNPSSTCLIFCHSGRVKTSCIVGCYRKLYCHWSLSAILEEFELCADGEGDIADFLVIEHFQSSMLCGAYPNPPATASSLLVADNPRLSLSASGMISS